MKNSNDLPVVAKTIGDGTVVFEEMVKNDEDNFSMADLSKNDNIRSMNYKKDPRTGKKSLKIVTEDGRVHRMTETRSGIKERINTETPVWNNKEERDNLIKEYYNDKDEKHTQEKTADAFGVSQPTVSNIVRRKK